MMLRNVVLGIASAMFAVMVTVGIVAHWVTLPAMIALALAIAALWFERRVYKANHRDRPGPEWTRTAERFIDPTTGESVVVYFDTRTGERRYVAE